MIEILTLSFAMGAALGGIFFIGLWWTVRKGLNAKNPAIWFLLSFLLRMGVALMGFYWIAQWGQWQHLALALLGFVLTRMLLTRLFSSTNKVMSQENTHAS